jgi:hypothetical protein
MGEIIALNIALRHSVRARVREAPALPEQPSRIVSEAKRCWATES